MLPNLLCNHLGDRNEMAHSIEARTPFLDHEVTEYVNMLPPSLKMRWSKNGNIDKWVLREAMKPYINEELYLRIKHPFIAPPAKSIDSALGKLFSGLSKDRIDQLGWMEWRFVEDMKRQFMNGDRRAQNCLLNIFSFVILSERFNVLKFE